MTNMVHAKIFAAFIDYWRLSNPKHTIWLIPPPFHKTVTGIIMINPTLLARRDRVHLL